MLEVNAILATMSLIGSNLPAYKQLLDQVIGMFDDKSQDDLRAGYNFAMAQAKAAHEAAQAL